jgi:glycosyltransferase involved in cell wall biosynthesis
MKIAFLVPDDREERRQYDVPEPYFGPAPTALLEGLAKMPDCEIHIVCCMQKPLRSPPKLAGNIFYHSMLVPKRGWLRGAYVGCVRAVRKKLREIKPDLVHGQGTERYCALAAVFSSFPNVLTLHGNMRIIAKLIHARPFSFDWLAARLERFTLPRTDGVVCISNYTQQNVKSLVRQTWVVPNAVRNIFFSTPRSATTGSPPILLNIGVVEPRKRQNEILEIAARLHARHPNFQLQFVGRLDKGPAYCDRFRMQIKQAEKAGYASYLGMKSVPELIELIDKAACLIHLPAEESFGLVVAECLARNLKLFGTKVGGIVDIAAGTEGAELFELGDNAGVEEAVFRWLCAGHPRPTQAARQMQERYHPELIARRHMEIYREILGHHGIN